MANELALINFHGDEIAAAWHEGEAYGSLRHMCDALGIDHSRQLRKLREVRWGRVVIMSTPDSRGHAQEMAMIPEKSVPMWLATISPGKVKPDAAAKLELFQDEMAAVLARYFSGEPKAVCDYDEADEQSKVLANLLRNRQEMLNLQREQRKQLEAIHQVKDIAERAEDTARAALETVNGYSGYLSVLAYARRHGLNISNGHLSAISRKAGAKCGEMGLESKYVPDARYEKLKVYPVEVLESLHDEFIARSSNAKLQLVEA